jgi:hypothetical protein
LEFDSQTRQALLADNARSIFTRVALLDDPAHDAHPAHDAVGTGR